MKLLFATFLLLVTHLNASSLKFPDEEWKQLEKSSSGNFLPVTPRVIHEVGNDHPGCKIYIETGKSLWPKPEQGSRATTRNHIKLKTSSERLERYFQEKMKSSDPKRALINAYEAPLYRKLQKNCMHTESCFDPEDGEYVRNITFKLTEMQLQAVQEDLANILVPARLLNNLKTIADAHDKTDAATRAKAAQYLSGLVWYYMSNLDLSWNPFTFNTNEQKIILLDVAIKYHFLAQENTLNALDQSSTEFEENMETIINRINEMFMPIQEKFINVGEIDPNLLEYVKQSQKNRAASLQQKFKDALNKQPEDTINKYLEKLNERVDLVETYLG